MNSIIVLYPGGFHGEFFIGNIVTNTDKFHYYYFKCRSEKLNAYGYECLNSSDEHGNKYPIISTDITDEVRRHYHTYYGKPIISRTHNFKTTFTLPVAKLYTADVMYKNRGVLLQCIKSLDKTYSNIDGVPLPPPPSLARPPKVMENTTDRILHIDIKEWLHNENLEKIEDFFQIEYTQAMKDAVTQYYERDEILLNKYIPDWKKLSNINLIDEMARIDKEFKFYGWQVRCLVV